MFPQKVTFHYWSESPEHLDQEDTMLRQMKAVKTLRKVFQKILSEAVEQQVFYQKE